MTAELLLERHLPAPPERVGRALPGRRAGGRDRWMDCLDRLPAWLGSDRR